MRYFYILVMLVCLERVNAENCINVTVPVCKTLQMQNMTSSELENLQYNLAQQEVALKLQKISLRAQIKRLKQDENKRKQRLRLQSKCEKVRRHIEQLNKRYRQGYTVTQGNQLDRKLALLKLKQQDYCG